ncbi:protein of unknown function [Streptomyces sp. DvalAA-43]|jgi:hypothetical protein|nr:protein of unknown function [Streptomyces sp. DvalAA-43]
MNTLRTIHDVPVLICAEDALDLIGDAGYQGARWVVVPAGRFDESFFRLGTRVAGDIVQKFVNYRMGIVVLGDISRHTEAGSALRASSASATGAGRPGSSPKPRSWGSG